MSARRTLLIAAFILAVAGCTSSGSTSATATAASPPAVSRSRTPHPTVSPVVSPSPTGTSTPVPGLIIVHDPGKVTGTLHGPCHIQGQLPDHACTPGAIDITITAAVLCSGHYSTKTYRPPEAQTQAFKYNEAYPAYGLPQGTKTELDHLVSLELGGANDAANLWPETPPTPNPKDTVENALHAWVCAVSGTASQDRLAKAQLAIAGNWTTAEKVLGVTLGPSLSPASSSLVPSPSRIASSSAPAQTACYPRTSGGNCYRPGELCRAADHGASGIDGAGQAITCRDNNGWRWEAA